MPFDFFQLKFHFGLRQDLLLIHADDARPLLEFPRTAAPARPNAQPHASDRQLRSRHNINDADQSLHSVKLVPHVLAQDAALQVGQDNFGRRHFVNSNHALTVQIISLPKRSDKGRRA